MFIPYASMSAIITHVSKYFFCVLNVGLIFHIKYAFVAMIKKLMNLIIIIPINVAIGDSVMDEDIKA